MVRAEVEARPFRALAGLEYQGSSRVTVTQCLASLAQNHTSVMITAKEAAEVMRCNVRILFDEADRFRHNHHASVASLRRLFIFTRNSVRLPLESPFTFTGIRTCSRLVPDLPAVL